MVFWNNASADTASWLPFLDRARLTLIKRIGNSLLLAQDHRHEQPIALHQMN